MRLLSCPCSLSTSTFSRECHSQTIPGPVPITELKAGLGFDRAYRIRERTEKEKQSRISQDVARQHEWEAGLVGTYKRFLEICERDVKGSSVCPRARPAVSLGASPLMLGSQTARP